MKAVCRKISSGVFVLRRLSSYVGLDVFLTAYYGINFPNLSYTIEIWEHECG